MNMNMGLLVQIQFEFFNGYTVIVVINDLK